MIVMYKFMDSTYISSFFFFNDTATTEIYTLSLHDALPICLALWHEAGEGWDQYRVKRDEASKVPQPFAPAIHSCGRAATKRSEEHTSELQSRQYLVCRLLLEKNKNQLLSSCISQH